jgi:hypothetical protein
VQRAIARAFSTRSQFSTFVAAQHRSTLRLALEVHQLERDARFAHTDLPVDQSRPGRLAV